mmetsp:Transcript_22713/g.36586  ORF Transcript_22713/g.36586 Transcript_22713/m.36586 type:complete len:543 (-) Transcript_22713:145-1773(-)
MSTIAALTVLCLYGVEANTPSKKWTQKNVAKGHSIARKNIDGHLERHLTNVKSAHPVELQNTAGFCQYTSMFDCNVTTCAACVAKGTGWYWVGYCAGFQADIAGVAWSVDNGMTDCTASQKSREWTVRCEDSNAEETDNCNSTLASIYNFSGVSMSRMDTTIHPDISIMDYTTGQIEVTGFYNSLEFELVSFMLHGGHSVYTEGPPALYQMAGYMYIPKGGFSQTSARLKGSSTYVVFDSGYKYDQASYTSGVGSTTSFSGVSFTNLRGSLSSLTLLGGASANKNVTSEVCSSGNGVCLSMTVSSQGFTKEGLTLDDSSSKVDVYVNNIAYTGSENSYGFRMLSVSTSYSGTVLVDDTGNAGNEESETFGAAFLITENTAYAKNSAISASNPGTTTAAVQKQSQSAGTTGADCGYTSSDWFATSAVDPDNGRQYANAAEFFQTMGMSDMKCLFYSFAANNAAHTYFLWDPILGIDKAAAKSSALGTSSSSDDSSSDDNTGLIAGVVVGVVCGVALIAGLVYYLHFHKKNTRTGGAAAPGNAL